MDIDKCEFETTKVKYLGFVIQTGKGIRMDSNKMKAIRNWEPPKFVKGVKAFLSFLNFYKGFI